MAILRAAKRAFGAPGIAPRWTQSAKDAIGTAYSAGSTVWFTVSAGILNEVYYPTIDRPQIRDLQYLVTDGESFFHDERRHLETRLEPLANNALGVRITNADREGRYRIVKEVIGDPHQPCILIRTRLEGDEQLLARPPRQRSRCSPTRRRRGGGRGARRAAAGRSAPALHPAPYAARGRRAASTPAAA